MYEAAVIGVSAGGFEALKLVLPGLPASFALPIVIVQHLGSHRGGLPDYLSNCRSLQDCSRI